MTREDVARRIDMLVAYADDDEKAHEMEDQLHQDVLQAIATGTCSDPAGCANEALRTLSIEFERWCA
jgi:hypothetical protein